MTVGLLSLLSLASPAIAQDTAPSSGEDRGFDIFPGFPGSATRVMFYVMVGII